MSWYPWNFPSSQAWPVRPSGRGRYGRKNMNRHEQTMDQPWSDDQPSMRLARPGNMNGGFHGKITNKWSIFQQAVVDAASNASTVLLLPAAGRAERCHRQRHSSLALKIVTVRQSSSGLFLLLGLFISRVGNQDFDISSFDVRITCGFDGRTPCNTLYKMAYCL